MNLSWAYTVWYLFLILIFSRFVVGGLVLLKSYIQEIIQASGCFSRQPSLPSWTWFNCIKGVLSTPSCVRDIFIYKVLKKTLVLAFFLLSIINFIWFYRALSRISKIWLWKVLNAVCCLALKRFVLRRLP